MYCSSCGSAASPGLDYCNRCGARLAGASADARRSRSSELPPGILVPAMVFCFVFGLAAIMGLLVVMKEVFDNPGLINAFALLSFALLVAIESIFAWMLVRRTGDAHKATAPRLANEQTTNELNATRARALPDPVPSVTEHTTRTFDPVYVERKSE
jgi:hypothetical protein